MFRKRKNTGWKPVLPEFGGSLPVAARLSLRQHRLKTCATRLLHILNKPQDHERLLCRADR